MKKFRYPLERLKQVRELELNQAADELREIIARLQEVRRQIEQKENAIADSNRTLVDAEQKNGMVRPDLRKLAAIYVQTVRLEQKKLEQLRGELEQEHDTAHAALLEKKQSVKILENHEERLSSSHRQAMQTLQQKEDDELWLSRQQDGNHTEKSS